MNIQYNNNDFNKLLQYFIRKGNKSIIEKNFRKALFFYTKNGYKNLNFTIEQSLKNITPHVNIKTTRKGRRNFYIPTQITKKHSNYLAASWLSMGIKNKSNKKFYIKLIEELLACANKTSIGFQKKEDLYKLVESNIDFLKSNKSLKINQK